MQETLVTFAIFVHTDPLPSNMTLTLKNSVALKFATAQRVSKHDDSFGNNKLIFDSIVAPPTANNCNDRQQLVETEEGWESIMEVPEIVPTTLIKPVSVIQPVDTDTSAETDPSSMTERAKLFASYHNEGIDSAATRDEKPTNITKSQKKSVRNRRSKAQKEASRDTRLTSRDTRPESAFRKMFSKSPTASCKVNRLAILLEAYAFEPMTAEEGVETQVLEEFSQSAEDPPCRRSSGKMSLRRAMQNRFRSVGSPPDSSLKRLDKANFDPVLPPCVFPRVVLKSNSELSTATSVAATFEKVVGRIKQSTSTHPLSNVNRIRDAYLTTDGNEHDWAKFKQEIAVLTPTEIRELLRPARVRRTAKVSRDKKPYESIKPSDIAGQRNDDPSRAMLSLSSKRSLFSSSSCEDLFASNSFSSTSGDSSRHTDSKDSQDTPYGAYTEYNEEKVPSLVKMAMTYEEGDQDMLWSLACSAPGCRGHYDQQPEFKNSPSMVQYQQSTFGDASSLQSRRNYSHFSTVASEMTTNNSWTGDTANKE